MATTLGGTIYDIYKKAKSTLTPTPEIDPALKTQLEQKGQYQRIADLQKGMITAPLTIGRTGTTSQTSNQTINNQTNIPKSSSIGTTTLYSPNGQSLNVPTSLSSVYQSQGYTTSPAISTKTTPNVTPQTNTYTNNGVSNNQDFMTQYQDFMNKYSPDYSSEEAAVKQAEQDRLNKMRDVINKQAEQQRLSSQKLGQKKEEGYKAGLGMSEGLNWSSLGTDALNRIGQETQAEIEKIDEAERQALETADTTSIENLQKQLSQLRTMKSEKEKQLLDIFNASQKQITATDDVSEYNFYAQQEQNAGRTPISYLEWKLQTTGKTSGTGVVEVSPGASLYDKTTGEFVGTAPSKPSDNEPVTKTVGEKLLQWDPTSQTWKEAYSATTSETPYKNEQFNLLDTAMAGAEQFADAAGRAPWREGIARGLFGATDMTKLQSYAQTLKTNLLTLATDPAVKKFFGPQMSNADVKMMMAGGTTLDPELQGPVEFKAELTRVKDLINRMKNSVNQGMQSGTSSRVTNIEDVDWENVVPSK